MPYEVRDSVRQDNRNLSRADALKELAEFATGGWIDCLQIRYDEGLGDIFFIAVFPKAKALMDDWVTVESDEFVSRDAAIKFLEEISLTNLIEERPS